MPHPAVIAGLAHVAILAAAGPVGAGIQPGPVCAATTVQPGHSYNLPPVVVANTGSGDEHMSLTVIKPDASARVHGQMPSASWVQFGYPRGFGGLTGEASVLVHPGTTARVPVRLTLPASAAPGPYVAWISVNVTGTGGPPVHFGAAAAAYLEFTVTRPGSPSRPGPCVTPRVKHHQAKPAGHATPRRTRRAATAADGAAPHGHSPKTYAIIAGVALGGIALIVPRRRRR